MYDITVYFKKKKRKKEAHCNLIMNAVYLVLLASAKNSHLLSVKYRKRVKHAFTVG